MTKHSRNGWVDWAKEIHTALEMGKQGKSLREIAEHYGVSRERVRQVFKQYKVDPESVGQRVTRKAAREARNAAYRLKWGDKQDTDLYAAQRHKFTRKKAHATRVGWEWEIEFGPLEWPTHCPILGIELDYFSEYRAEASPSFDRLDTSKGYVPGNVQILSWRANRIKNDGTAEEHRKIADYLDALM